MSLSRKPLAPWRIAVAARSSRLNVVSTITRTGWSARATRSGEKICRVASTPSISGIRMSISTTSGGSSSTSRTASTPSPAAPTTRMPSWASMMTRTPSRNSSWSSTSSTLIVVAVIGPARTGTHAVTVKVVRSASLAAAYVELAADRLEPAPHAVQALSGRRRRLRPSVGRARRRRCSPRSAGRGPSPRPVPLDHDRLVAPAVLDRVGEHLLEHPVGHHLELGRQRLRGARPRSTTTSWPLPRTPSISSSKPPRRRAGCAVRGRGEHLADVLQGRARRGRDRLHGLLQLRGVGVSRYCADSAWARITASEWPTTSCTSRARRAC